jgi:hypothetical protein
VFLEQKRKRKMEKLNIFEKKNMKKKKLMMRNIERLYVVFLVDNIVEEVVAFGEEDDGRKNKKTKKGRPKMFRDGVPVPNHGYVSVSLRSGCG